MNDKARQYAALALGILLTVSLLVPVSSSAEEDGASESPRFVVNLLDYLASDYGGAVSGSGEVLNASEYEEQREFAAATLRAAQNLPQLSSAPEVVQRIETLQQLVESRAQPTEVAALARQAKAAVIEVAQVEMAPLRWPNLEHGRALFQTNCVACHGVEGRGDGPAGAGLDPAPADFWDPKLDGVSPFQAFNVIRVGVPGTAMAPFAALSDDDLWDLAFYVISFRHQPQAGTADAGSPAALIDDALVAAASRSDQELLPLLAGEPKDRELALSTLRLHSEAAGATPGVAFARSALRNAGDEYRAGKQPQARTYALRAYLEGVEPLEPRLRANGGTLGRDLEEKMAAVRSAIEAHQTPDQVDAAIASADRSLEQVARALETSESSAWVTFLIAAGILLREGFEAVLVVIALLAVIRAADVPEASRFVHAGWLGALGLGVLAWVFSGWLMKISGAQRELMEAITSLLAVFVLIYMGFWLHSKTEIHRWKHFIEVQLREAIATGSRLGLAGIAFTAVFREAFETVLFLRALWLEGADSTGAALGLGVLAALAIVLVGAWVILRYSARIPVPKVFMVSSLLMVALSVILMGKGLHALQEIGYLGITPSFALLRFETLGIYPTDQTLLGQAVVLVLALGLWFLAKRPPVPVGGSAVPLQGNAPKA